MKKNLLFLYLLICCFLPCLAQNEGNFWYFGNKVGLDFNGGCDPIVVTDGEIDGYEGCATISDRTTGQLLFYTNSVNVWDKNGDLMNNGPLVFNGRTITQVTIVPHPGDDSIYYIITSEIQSFSGEGLVAHGIDLRLNGGVGGLSFSDSLLHATPMSEKVVPVRHANGTDIWIIAHEANSNHFVAYLLTAAGFNMTPVVSAIWKVYSPANYDAIGEMRVSPDGTKLAAVTLTQPNVELFDFDNATGIISNLIVLPENGGYDSLGNNSGFYGVSFSPNSQVLYASKWIAGNTPATLMQYDISSGDSATISASRVDVFTSMTKNSYGLKIAPNGKIYRGQNNNYLGVINFPDSLGMACGYMDNGLLLNVTSDTWGLNNLMETQTYCTPPTAIRDPKIETMSVSAHPNPASGTVAIEYSLPIGVSNGEIVFFDMAGHEMRRFGIDHSATRLFVSTTEIPAGTYLYQLQAQGDGSTAKRMVVIK